MTKQQQFLSYAHAFLVAADMHATAAKEKGIDGEVDGMICIIALQNAAVGAIRALGKGHHAVQQYKTVAGDLKNVRDMLVHFDAYAVGDGNLQQNTAAKVPASPSTRLQRLVGLFRKPAEVDVSDHSEADAFGWMTQWATDETMIVLNRRKGEEDATWYQVPIHEALKNVAILVTAAAESTGKKPSPLLLRLTADRGTPN